MFARIGCAQTFGVGTFQTGCLSCGRRQASFAYKIVLTSLFKQNIAAVSPTHDRARHNTTIE